MNSKSATSPLLSSNSSIAPYNSGPDNQHATFTSPESQYFDSLFPSALESLPYLEMPVQESPQYLSRGTLLPGAAASFYQGHNTSMPWSTTGYEMHLVQPNPQDQETGAHLWNLAFEQSPDLSFNQDKGGRKLHAATWSLDTPATSKKKALEVFKTKMSQILIRAHSLFR